MPFLTLIALLCCLLCGCGHQEPSQTQLSALPPEDLSKPSAVSEAQTPLTWPLDEEYLFDYHRESWQGETWLVAQEIDSGLCWPLVKEGHFVAELPGGVVYHTKDASDDHDRYYYHEAATGRQQPLDITHMSASSVQDGKLYFSTHGIFSCFDPATNSVTEPFSEALYWYLDGDTLYYLDGQNGFHRAVLDGEDTLLFHYEGLVDMVHLAEMWVADDCLYLYGTGYHYGGWLTSCIPLAGGAVQEEVFWQDRWMTADEYHAAFQKEPADTVMDEEVKAAFAAVLLDGGTMTTETGAAVTLEERLTPLSETVSYKGYRAFSVVDLDQDGVPEVVFQKRVNAVDCYDILWYHEGQIQVFTQPYRGFREVKADGSFLYSGSAFQTGYGRLVFTEEGAQTNTIGLYEGFPDENGIVQPQYTLGGRPVVEAVLSAFAQAQNQKEDLTWIEYTVDELENALR